jgi:hypothetical protein
VSNSSSYENFPLAGSGQFGLATLPFRSNPAFCHVPADPTGPKETPEGPLNKYFPSVSFGAQYWLRSIIEPFDLKSEKTIETILDAGEVK